MKKGPLLPLILIGLFSLPIVAMGITFNEFKAYTEMADFGFLVITLILGAIPGAAAAIPFVVSARKTTRQIMEAIDKSPVKTTVILDHARNNSKTKAVRELRKILPRSKIQHAGE